MTLPSRGMPFRGKEWLYSVSASSDCFCLEHGEKTIAKSLFTTYGNAALLPISGEGAGRRRDVDQWASSARQSDAIYCTIDSLRDQLTCSAFRRFVYVT